MLPNVKDVGSCYCWDVNVITGLVKEDLEVTDNSIGSLPAFSHSARLRNLDPAFTSCSHTVVDVNTKWELSCVSMTLCELAHVHVQEGGCQ